MTFAEKLTERFEKQHLSTRNELRTKIMRSKYWRKHIAPQLPDLSWLDEEGIRWHMYTTTTPPELDLPVNETLRERIKQAFLDAGWELVYDNRKEESKESTLTFLPPEEYLPEKVARNMWARYQWFAFEVEFYNHIEGSTCRQVQVGTEWKEVPIMKVMCGDEAVAVETLIAAGANPYNE